jgi:hypothetical protein
MTAVTGNVILSATTTTKHRNWARAVSDALTAVGLTLTGDTGQIDLTGSTLAYPTISSDNVLQWSGYEIREMVAAGLPTIYLKVWYGLYPNGSSHGVTGYWPGMRIDIGSATDGAGTLTKFNASGAQLWSLQSSGQMSGSSAPNSNQPGPVAQDFYVASDGANYLTICLGSNAPSYEASVIICGCIERTNTPGAAAFTYNGDGIASICWDNFSNDTIGGNGNRQMLYDLNNHSVYLGSTVSAQTPSYVYEPNVTTDSSQYPITIGVGHGPFLAAISYHGGTMIENISYNATVYGAVRTFKPFIRSAGNVADPYSTTSLALRFD